MNSNNKRLQNVAMMRWLGALFVMTGHIYCLLQQAPPTLLWNAIQTLGIKIFFVLGGFLVTGSWAREHNIRNYAIKRVTRIFPPLILFVFVSAVVVGPVLSNLSLKEYYSNPLFFRYLLNGILYINYALPGVFEYNPYPVAVNGSLWSLPVEVFMYFLIPFFYIISKRNRKLGIGIVFLVCVLCVLRRAFFPEWHYVIYGTDLGSMIEVVPYYFIGMLIYLISEERDFLPKVKIEIAVLIIALSYIVPGSNEIINLIVSLLCIPYVVMGIANSENNSLTDILSRHEITYGIFLYGFFIQQCVIYFVYANNLGWSLNTIEICALLFTIFFSECSFRFVERPIIKWSKKLLKNN